MFKKGFTLAEVLITLMIIGVVATLTTPALVKNVGSSKIGPQLSKFVNTWETATETMLMEENTSTLSAANNNTFDTTLMEKLSRYMIMTSLKNNSGKYGIMDSNGSAVVEQTYSSGTIWQLKDGTIIQFADAKAPDGWWYLSTTGAYKGPLGFLYVDIGGIKGSHRVGKEVFAFIVDETGILIPYGSSTNKSLYKDFKYECNQASTDWQDLLACTGAVADNGWKAPW